MQYSSLFRLLWRVHRKQHSMFFFPAEMSLQQSVLFLAASVYHPDGIASCEGCAIRQLACDSQFYSVTG